MTDVHAMPEPVRLSQTLKASLRAGSTVGAFAGLFDGLVRTLGVDSGLFLIRLQEEGVWPALTHGAPSLDDLPGLLGCTAAAVTLYVSALSVLAVAAGLLLHPLLRRRPSGATDQLALWLGFWFFLEVYWWTRPVVLPGLPATSVKRLIAAAVIFLACQGAGILVARLKRRLPQDWLVHLPLIGVLLWIGGGVYLRVDRKASAGHLGQVNERNEDMPNVLLFVVDALRQDVLGCYGSERVQTPHLDRLADEGVLFADAFVQAPFTWPSFGSFLTGKYPRRHGLIRMAPGYTLPPNLTLPEYLHGAPRQDGGAFQDEDMVGAAFLTGTLSHGSGLARGFDYYFEALVGHELVDVHSRWSEFRSGLLPWLYKNKLHQKLDNQLVATTAREWFQENASRRFVSMVHYYSTHTPYDPPDKFRDLYCDPDYQGPIEAFYASHREAIERGEYALTEADAQQIRNLYYAGVTQADAMIGDVLDELRLQGVLDDTIVVVTSDHGESLGEHGLWEHNFMYQDNLKIPLLIRWPGGLPQGAVVDGTVESIDLLPTLTELLRLKPLKHASELPDGASMSERMEAIDGVSLLPRIRGEVEQVRRYSFAENGHYLSVQDARWKLIVRRDQVTEEGWREMLADPEVDRPRFYDLQADPLELQDLARSAFEQHAGTIEELATVLRGWSQSLPIRTDLVRSSHRDVDSEAARMAAFGYAGGVGAEVDEEEGEDGE